MNEYSTFGPNLQQSDTPASICPSRLSWLNMQTDVMHLTKRFADRVLCIRTANLQYVTEV